MPIVPDPIRPGWCTLVDADGIAIARYFYLERDGLRIADLVELEVPVERAVPRVLAELAGMRVGAPEELGRALAAAGATPHRLSHAYSHHLTDLPAIDTRYTLTPLHAVDLTPLYLAAFPPGHPDRMEPDEARRSLAAFAAEALPGSGLAYDGETLVGAIIVGTIPEMDPPFGGPWIVNVFRDPRAPGAGRALIARALAHTEGALGLAVTDGNPAERVYQRLGFRRTVTTYSVDL